MASLHVHYEYADGSANTIRPTSVTYPDGRVLTYDYGTAGGMNDRLSRVESLGFDGTGNLLQPAYLGLGTQVRTTLSEPQVRWDLATGSSPNPYAGLDRFGRVIDNKWTNYNTTATLDQIKYTYDRASNRTSRENVVAKAQTTPKYFDELYAYDGSNRLSLMERGQLAGSPPSSITNKQFAQDWGLDPTGNWKVFKEDANGDGTWELNQTRTSNPVNEITAINETAGPAWVTPGYDSAGNMTTIPRPAEPTGDFTGVYDAWNRLVALRGLDDTVVGRYEYDGLTRRVAKHTFPGWEELEAADWDAMTEEDWNGLQLTQAHRRDYYYSVGWRILEERVENDTVFDQQYVWGLRYIDGLVFRDRQLTSSVERNYALQDANWNVTALTDDNGVVVERYSYSAYGVPSFLNPDFTPAANQEIYDWDVLYAGYKRDSESALYQVRFRYLQPAIGTWVSRDPVKYYRRKINLYRVQTINQVDPLGLEDKVVAGVGQKIPRAAWIEKYFYRKEFDDQTKSNIWYLTMTGCIGLTSANVVTAINPTTKKDTFFADGEDRPIPDVSNCFRKIESAKALRDKWAKDGNVCKPCENGQFTVSMAGSKPRIFELQYSSKNWDRISDKVTERKPQPVAKDSELYNLNNQADVESIVTRAADGAVNYDFALLSEEGDAWYDPNLPWLHANEGDRYRRGEDGKKVLTPQGAPIIDLFMKIKLADTDGMTSQYVNNRSEFDERFYCVACARCL